MRIRLNGAERETSAENVAQLVDELNLPRQTVLVELDGEALRRSEWDTSQLREGSAIELLRIAAGG